MNVNESRKLVASYKSMIIDLLKNGSCTLFELQEMSGISLPLLKKVLLELVKDHTVYDKSGSYVLNNNYINTLCISIYRDTTRIHLRYRVYNAVDEIRLERDIIKKNISINDIYDIIDTVLISYSHIQTIGISMPGIIENGYVTSAHMNSDAFDHINIRELLNQRYRQQVVLENDANTAAVGFYVRKAEYHSVAVIFQPVSAMAGIGIVINGKLLTGKTHLAGEAQFMPIDFSSPDRAVLLQSPEGFEELITKYAQNIIAMINPEAIGIACNALRDYEPVIENLKKIFPHCSDLPDLITLDDLCDDNLIGLNLLCRDAYEKEKHKDHE